MTTCARNNRHRENPQCTNLVMTPKSKLYKQRALRPYCLYCAKLIDRRNRRQKIIDERGSIANRTESELVVLGALVELRNAREKVEVDDRAYMRSVVELINPDAEDVLPVAKKLKC